MRNFLDREIKCDSLNVETLVSEDSEPTPHSKTALDANSQTIIEANTDISCGLNEEEEALYLSLEQEFLS